MRDRRRGGERGREKKEMENEKGRVKIITEGEREG